MDCPFCRHSKSEVYNSRQHNGQSYVWRRRRCLNCHKPFTTHETADLRFLTVMKRNGSQEPYTRLKLLVSMYQAYGYNTHYADTIESLTETIESGILDLRKTEISTKDIADTVMAVLKRHDPALFMRYLSYRSDLTSMQQLKHELQEL